MEIRDKLRAKEASAVIFTALDEIACTLITLFMSSFVWFFCSLAWLDGTYCFVLLFVVGLFNLRGSDIVYNPVFFAYAIVTREDVWYIYN